MSHTQLFHFLLTCSLSLPASAAIIRDESVSGNFSNDRLSPTAISVAEGSNQILGTNGSEAPFVRDYVTFAIPTGFVLSSIIMLNTSFGEKGFIGMQAGTQVTLPPNTVTAAGLLGWWHYTPADIGVDILPLMAVPANGSSGFSLPVGPGSYTLWIQDSSPGLFNYGFDLHLQQVPEPVTAGLCLTGLVTAGLLRRRFCSSAARAAEPASK